MGHELNRNIVLSTNESLVLSTLLNGEALTRAQICARTGLSRPTVLEVLAAMSHDRLTSAHIPALGGNGRSPEFISLDPSRVVGFAADVGGSKVVAALVDFTGRVLAEHVVKTESNAVRVAEQLGELRKSLAAEADVSLRSLSTAVVGLPGVLGQDGHITHGENIKGLDAQDMRVLLRQHLKCPVRIENDVNLAGLGELDCISDDVNGTFVLISLGTGLGMAILHEGHVIRGAHGRAGEIAFLPLFNNRDNPDARIHGSSELMTSGPALERRYVERIGAGQSEVSAASILDLSSRGDSISSEVVGEFAADLSRVIVSVVTVLDPTRVVLAGGLGANPLLLQPLLNALEGLTPFAIDVRTSQLGNRSGICGALALARDEVRRILTGKVINDSGVPLREKVRGVV
jgi:glucokinase